MANLKKMKAGQKVRVPYSNRGQGRILGVSRKTNNGEIFYNVKFENPFGVQIINHRDLAKVKRI